MRSFLSVSLAALLSQAFALNPLEKLAVAPTGWTVDSVPPSSQKITLQVALTQQNINQLEDKLYSVSTPGSPEYGQHLSKEDVDTLFAPSSATISAVTNWLKKAGITAINQDGDMVTFTTTVGTADKLLSTSFKNYANGGVTKLRTLQYTVPEALKADIDFITPTTYFGKPQSQRASSMIKRTLATKTSRDAPSKRGLSPPCRTSISPACLKELYNVTAYVPSATSGSRIAFGSFLNQSARHADLFQYEDFNNIARQDFNNIFISKAQNNQSDTTQNDGEANLDVQNIIGVSHPLPVTQYLTGGSPPFIPDPTESFDQNEPYLPYYQFLLRQQQRNLPQVITNSYGEDEDTVPQRYAVRVCNLIGMLGLRGITVLESSGDLGVGAACVSTDGKNTTQFSPIFPATCPYLTSVGGTQSVGPEIAWVGSSGGFSYYFPRPRFQYFTVEDYLKKRVKPSVLKYYSPYFNQSGRGFPDVSAHSVAPNYQVVYNGQLSPSGGTSAASPVWAAVIGLVNDALLRNGKPVMGWLNPFLYHRGKEALNDITLGRSIGCNGYSTQSGQPVPGSHIIPYAHWNATIGWDPVTGLGTPNLGKLVELALSLGR